MQNRPNRSACFICIGIKWSYECIAVLAAREILSLFHSHSLLADGDYFNFLIMMVIIYVEMERAQEVTWSQCSSILGRVEASKFLHASPF